MTDYRSENCFGDKIIRPYRYDLGEIVRIDRWTVVVRFMGDRLEQFEARDFYDNPATGDLVAYHVEIVNTKGGGRQKVSYFTLEADQ